MISHDSNQSKSSKQILAEDLRIAVQAIVAREASRETFLSRVREIHSKNSEGESSVAAITATVGPPESTLVPSRSAESESRASQGSTLPFLTVLLRARLDDLLKSHADLKNPTDLVHRAFLKLGWSIEVSADSFDRWLAAGACIMDLSLHYGKEVNRVSHLSSGGLLDVKLANDLFALYAHAVPRRSRLFYVAILSQVFNWDVDVLSVCLGVSTAEINQDLFVVAFTISNELPGVDTNG